MPSCFATPTVGSWRPTSTVTLRLCPSSTGASGWSFPSEARATTSKCSGSTPSFGSMKNRRRVRSRCSEPFGPGPISAAATCGFSSSEGGAARARCEHPRHAPPRRRQRPPRRRCRRLPRRTALGEDLARADDDLASSAAGGEISTTYVFVRSRSSSVFSASSTAARFFGFAMSMKSMTMIPPMSRSRSWRTTSLTASRLFFVIVSSSRPADDFDREPTKRPC